MRARLRAFRDDAGLTVADVASYLEIPTHLYVAYEEYELIPHPLIGPVCEILNVSAWHLLTGLSDELSPPY